MSGQARHRLNLCYVDARTGAQIIKSTYISQKKKFMEITMKKLLFILIVLSFHFLCYSREIDFDYEYHNYESYNINEKIKVTTKQKKMLIFQSTESYTQEAVILFVKLSMFQLQQKRKILFLQ